MGKQNPYVVSGHFVKDSCCAKKVLLILDIKIKGIKFLMKKCLDSFDPRSVICYISGYLV